MTLEVGEILTFLHLGSEGLVFALFVTFPSLQHKCLQLSVNRCQFAKGVILCLVLASVIAFYVAIGEFLRRFDAVQLLQFILSKFKFVIKFKISKRVLKVGFPLSVPFHYSPWILSVTEIEVVSRYLPQVVEIEVAGYIVRRAGASIVPPAGWRGRAGGPVFIESQTSSEMVGWRFTIEFACGGTRPAKIFSSRAELKTESTSQPTAPVSHQKCLYQCFHTPQSSGQAGWAPSCTLRI
jgi:hypothetical protein